MEVQEKICFKDRQGLKLFADFYSLSSFYDKDNFLDREMAKELLPCVRSDVLRAGATAIFSEIRYFEQVPRKLNGHWKVFNRFNVGDIVRRIIPLHRKERYFYAKRHKAIVRLIAAGRVIFNRPNAFASNYGGLKWAEICKRWLDLHNYRDFNNDEMFVKIDKLIDAAHNTGRCLDKVYSGINGWLTTKTTIQNPYWVINQCCFRKYAKRRMKEQYKLAGFTEEKFSIDANTVWQNDLSKITAKQISPIFPLGVGVGKSIIIQKAYSDITHALDNQPKPIQQLVKAVKQSKQSIQQLKEQQITAFDGLKNCALFATKEQAQAFIDSNIVHGTIPNGLVHILRTCKQIGDVQYNYKVKW